MKQGLATNVQRIVNCSEHYNNYELNPLAWVVKSLFLISVSTSRILYNNWLRSFNTTAKTSCLKRPHKQKSQIFSLGDLGGHDMKYGK